MQSAKSIAIVVTFILTSGLGSGVIAKETKTNSNTVNSSSMEKNLKDTNRSNPKESSSQTKCMLFPRC